jgi:cytoskeleton protein RodZ
MDNTQESSAGDLRKSTYSGAGFLLRSAREEQGLTLSDIAVRTRIPMRQLEVIEAGAFEVLPSRTYAIGFVRTYARAIGLNEATLIESVRSELGDKAEPRTQAASAMEPGDPAKLPSKGLAWAGAIAALLLAIGLFAWFGNYFGAGEGAAPMVSEPTDAAAAEGTVPVATDAAPATSGVVTFTALEDGVWVRLYQEDGARLLEKTLVRGESFTVPATASNPRLNTARPDALGVTVDGSPVARLAERPVILGGEAVSAAALLARPTVASSAPIPATASATVRPASLGQSAPAATRRAATASPAATSDTVPEPAPQPLPAAPDTPQAGRSDAED